MKCGHIVSSVVAGAETSIWVASVKRRRIRIILRKEQDISTIAGDADRWPWCLLMGTILVPELAGSTEDEASAHKPPGPF